MIEHVGMRCVTPPVKGHFTVYRFPKINRMSLQILTQTLCVFNKLIRINITHKYKIQLLDDLWSHC